MTRPARRRSTAENRDEVRRRLAEAERPVERTPEQRRRVMDERARSLAQAPATLQQPAALIEILTCVLGAERYALETRFVREVLRFADFTPVPGAPDFVVGIANLRGEIVAVMDLRRIFGVPVKGLTDLSRVVVLGTERAEFGVLVDQAEAVTTLPVEGLIDPPGSVAGIGRDYLRGVTADALIVLDGAVLLKDARLYVNQVEGGVT